MLRTLLLAGLLVTGGASAQDNVFYQSIATDDPAPPPPPPPEAGRTHDNRDADLEARLDAARERLQEAAREVAELTNQLDMPFYQKFSTLNGGFGRAIIGVQLDPASGKEGARVLEVSPGGPAADAGIRAGDVIVGVNGTEVKGEDAARQVVNIIRGVKPDSQLKLRVLREGQARDFTVTARRGPGVMAFAGGFADMPPMMPTTPLFMMQGPLSNMELATLTPQLGKYFGTEKGVLVVRAPPDGALQLEDGDVILAIDSREPKSGSHATRILGSYQPGEKIMLRIVRQHKTMDLEATVPEQPGARRKSIMLRRAEPLAPVPGKVVIMRGGDESST